MCACATIVGCSGPGSSGASGEATVAPDLLAAVKQRGTLIVATDANFKPQSYQDADGNWKGFDVDVGREIAQRLGVKPVFVNTLFDRVAQGKWNGRWDLNIGSMTITPARARVLWFTQPYYFDPAAFAVHTKSAVRSIRDLSGKKIGVSRGSTYLTYLQGKLPTARVPSPAGTKLVLYDTDVPALDDLSLGNGVKLDAVLSSLSAITDTIKGGKQLRVLEPPVYEESLAIALDRESQVDNRPLLWAIDSAIQQMHQDGTLRRLSMEYYGLDLSVRR
jgi:polar amino acid transport system substrate-binding protein